MFKGKRGRELGSHTVNVSCNSRARVVCQAWSCEKRLLCINKGSGFRILSEPDRGDSYVSAWHSECFAGTCLSQEVPGGMVGNCRGHHICAYTRVVTTWSLANLLFSHHWHAWKMLSICNDREQNSISDLHLLHSKSSCVVRPSSALTVSRIAATCPLISFLICSASYSMEWSVTRQKLWRITKIHPFLSTVFGLSSFLWGKNKGGTYEILRCSIAEFCIFVGINGTNVLTWLRESSQITDAVPGSDALLHASYVRIDNFWQRMRKRSLTVRTECMLSINAILLSSSSCWSGPTCLSFYCCYFISLLTTPETCTTSHASHETVRTTGAVTTAKRVGSQPYVCLTAGICLDSKLQPIATSISSIVRPKCAQIQDMPCKSLHTACPICGVHGRAFPKYEASRQLELHFVICCTARLV